MENVSFIKGYAKLFLAIPMLLRYNHILYYVTANVTPVGLEYPLPSYITILWPIKPEWKLCRSSVIIGLSYQ